jgi:TPR repeat protein
MLVEAEEAGCPEVWLALGEAFRGGHGVEADVKRAEDWFRKGADAGHAPSMVQLGLLLSHPDRVPVEHMESVTWFRRAADLGDSRGMIWMGFAYREGKGVVVDETEAADWFIKAYAAGESTAARLAGRILAHMPETHLEAVNWLRISIGHGDDSSYYNIALLHQDRNSPAYDPAEAFNCWSRVAERPRGDLRFEAMLSLARCCRDGHGTERNRDKAIEWFDLLLSVAPRKVSEHDDAVKLRQEIEGDLL